FPEPGDAIIVAGGYERQIRTEGHGVDPRRLGPGGQYFPGSHMPEGEFIAGGSQELAIGAKLPEGFQIAQERPSQQLPADRIPLTQLAWLRNRPEGAVRGEHQSLEIAVAMKAKVAKDAPHLG